MASQFLVREVNALHVVKNTLGLARFLTLYQLVMQHTFTRTFIANGMTATFSGNGMTMTMMTTIARDPFEDTDEPDHIPEEGN